MAEHVKAPPEAASKPQAAPHSRLAPKRGPGYRRERRAAASDNAARQTAVSNKPGTVIVDDDAERAEATAAVLVSLLPQLGLRLSDIKIKVEGEAERRTAAHHTDGLMERGVIFLQPETFEPESRNGRHLLGHELAHLAQWKNGRNGDHAGGPAELAELEAQAIGVTFANGRTFPAPEIALPATAVAPYSQVSAAALAATVAQSRRKEINAVKDHLSGWWFTSIITDGAVERVLRILEGVSFVVAMGIVSNLTGEERIDLADNISKGHFKRFRSQILAAYAAMKPAEIKRFDEKLFNGMNWYGFSDEEYFAIRHVLQALPEKAADRLRQSEETKQAVARIDALSGDEDFQQALEKKMAEAREIAEEEENRVIKEREAAKEAYESDAGLRIDVGRIEKDLSSWLYVSDNEALRVLDIISTYLDRPAALRYIAERLDENGLLDTLLDNIPVKKLYEEVVISKTTGAKTNRRKTLLRLASYRPAHKNVALAEDLLTTSFFKLDWMISDEDAFLAFQLIKVVPAHTRAAFMAANGGEFATLLSSEMSVSMRESETMNFYGEAQPGRDLTSIQAQLLDDNLWSVQNIERLEGLIRMALAAGEGQWLFEQSKHYHDTRKKEYRNATFKERIVDKYELYDPAAGRLDYKPGKLKGLSLWTFDDGITGTINQYIFQGLDFIFSSDNVELATKSIGGRGLNLPEFQDIMGGSFLGARFLRGAELDKFAKRSGQKAGASKGGINFADVAWDLGDGILEMEAKHLALAAIHYPMDNLKLQTGEGEIQGLNLHVGYPTPGKKDKASFIKMDIGRLVLNDILLIWPDKMIGLNRLDVGNVGLRAAAGEVDYDNLAKARKGYLVPVPVFWGVIGSFVNLVRLTDWFGLPMDQIPVLGYVLKVDDPTSRLKKGLLEPELPVELDLTFGSVNVKGITSSGGHHIRSLELKDAAIRGGETRSAYKNALRKTAVDLEGRIAAARREVEAAPGEEERAVKQRVHDRLVRQKEAAETELAGIEQAEALLERLAGKEQKQPLSKEEKAEKTKAEALLKRYQKGGMAITAGHIKLSGMEGAVAADDIEINNLFGFGRGAVGALGTETIKRFMKGKSYKPVVLSAEKDEIAFALDLGDLAVNNLKIKGSIPTVREVRNELERVNERIAIAGKRVYRLELEKQRLEERLKKAEEYERMSRKGVTYLSAVERQRLLTLRQEFMDEREITVKHIGLKDTNIGFDPQGEAEFTAGSLDVTGIKTENLEIDRIAGEKVGLKGLLDPLGSIKKGNLRTEKHITISGIRHGTSGASIDTLTLEMLNATLDLEGEGSRRDAAAYIKANKVSATGVSLVVSEKVLLAELKALREKPPDERSEKDVGRITKIAAALDNLTLYKKELAEAERAVEKAQTPDEKEAADLLLEEKKAQLKKWQEVELVLEGLTIENLDVAVTGLGDIFADDYSFADTLESGLTIKAGTEGKPIFTSMTLTGSRIPGLAAQEVKIGATGGRIYHSNEKTELNNVTIASLSVTGLEYSGGGRKVWGRGTSTLTGITVDATLHNVQRKDARGKLAWYQDRIDLRLFKIESISADQLGYSDPKIRVEVESGSLGGITASGMTIKLPETEDQSLEVTSEPGKGLEILGVKDLKVAGTLASGLSGKGTLNGANLFVDFVAADHRVYRIGDLERPGFLSLTGGEISKPGGNKIRVSLNRLSGEVVQKGDNFQLNGIRVGNIVAGRSKWQDKDKTVEVKKKVLLEDIQLDAEVLQKRVKGKDADEEQVKFDNLKIKRLWIGKIEAADLILSMAARAADPGRGIKASEAKSITIPQAVIEGLELLNFDLSKMSGAITTKKVNVTDLAVLIGDKAKPTLEAGLSLSGTNMGGTLMSPGHFKIDLGQIESISGFFRGYGLDIDDFKAERRPGMDPRKEKFITGTIEFGKDFIQLENLEIDKSYRLHLGATEYKDATSGTVVKLKTVDIDGVHLRKLKATFGTVTTPTGPEEQMTNLTVEGLVLDETVAANFEYTGKAESKTAGGAVERKETTVSAEKATIKNFKLNNLDMDLLKKITTIDTSFDSADINKLDATLKSTVGKDVTATRIMTDLTAKGMVARMTFARHKLAAGDDWTSIDGSFHLDSLGLHSPLITYKETGKDTITIDDLDKSKGKVGSIDLTGLDIAFSPNGTLLLDLDDIIAKNLKLTKGGLNVSLAFAQVKEAALAMKGLGLDTGLEVLGAKAKEASVGGLKIEIKIDRPAPPPGAVTKATPRGPTYIVEPLDFANGQITLTASDGGDTYEFPLPIRDGVIDLEDSHSTTVGLSMDDDGTIYIDGLWIAELWTDSNVYIHQTRGLPGLYPDRGDEGQIVLRELVEGILNSAPPPPGMPIAAPEPLTQLNQLGLLNTVFRLGSGKIGTSKNFVELPGGSTQNWFRVLQSVVGTDLGIAGDDLEATRSSFEIGGKTLATDQIKLQGVEVHILNLANPTPPFTITITVEVKDGKVHNIRFGDVKMLNPAALKALPGPKLAPTK